MIVLPSIPSLDERCTELPRLQLEASICFLLSDLSAKIHLPLLQLEIEELVYPQRNFVLYSIMSMKESGSCLKPTCSYHSSYNLWLIKPITLILLFCTRYFVEAVLCEMIIFMCLLHSLDLMNPNAAIVSHSPSYLIS